MKSVALTPKLTNKPQSLKGSANAKIIDVGLSEYGLFVVRREDGSASVLKLNQNAIETIWDFADSVSCRIVLFQVPTNKVVPQANSNKNSDSMYTGAVDKQGNPYVGRMYWSSTLQVCDHNSWVEPVCHQLFHVERSSARFHTPSSWWKGFGFWAYLPVQHK